MENSPPEDRLDAILNTLTVQEVERCRTALSHLRGQIWAQELIRRIGPEEQWTRQRSGLFLELRLAGELHQQGIHPSYEIKHDGDKSIDFTFTIDGLQWLVEVVRPMASKAMHDAATGPSEAGIWEVSLASNNTDQRLTHAGELIRLQQQLADKALKFPLPAAGRFHVVLADTSRIGITGVDDWDALQLCYGPDGLPVHLVNQFDGHQVRGLFETEVPLLGASIFRERIHFVALTSDEAYGPDSLLGGLRACSNPRLFDKDANADDAFTTFPGSSTTNRLMR